MRSEGAVTRGFILPNGDIAKNGTQHDDIALEYLGENHLFDVYSESKYSDLCDFMVFHMGAIKVGCNISRDPRVVTYVEDMMTKEQWVYIEYYQTKGYRLDSL